MHLVGLHAAAQRGVHTLVALDQPLPLEHTGDDGGIPMPTVARQLNVFAVKAGADDGLEFFASRKLFIQEQNECLRK